MFGFLATRIILFESRCLSKWTHIGWLMTAYAKDIMRRGMRKWKGEHTNLSEVCILRLWCPQDVRYLAVNSLGCQKICGEAWPRMYGKWQSTWVAWIILLHRVAHKDSYFGLNFILYSASFFFWTRLLAKVISIEDVLSSVPGLAAGFLKPWITWETSQCQAWIENRQRRRWQRPWKNMLWILGVASWKTRKKWLKPL